MSEAVQKEKEDLRALVDQAYTQVAFTHMFQILEMELIEEHSNQFLGSNFKRRHSECKQCVAQPQ